MPEQAHRHNPGPSDRSGRSERCTPEHLRAKANWHSDVIGTLGVDPPTPLGRTSRIMGRLASGHICPSTPQATRPAAIGAPLGQNQAQRTTTDISGPKGKPKHRIAIIMYQALLVCGALLPNDRHRRIRLTKGVAPTLGAKKRALQPQGPGHPRGECPTQAGKRPSPEGSRPMGLYRAQEFDPDITGLDAAIARKEATIPQSAYWRSGACLGRATFVTDAQPNLRVASDEQPKHGS